MASRKPPLAEVRAAAVGSRRGSRSYSMTWVVDPEDTAIMDAFFNGPMAGHQVVIRLLTLEQGWSAPKCDPNISPEEAVQDDELARLREEHRALLTAMKNVPASDATSA